MIWAGVMLAVTPPVALAATGVEPGREEPGSDVFVEVSAERESSYVQQPVLLTLRVGVRRAFLLENLVQTFRRELDVPLQVEAQWDVAPAGTVLLPLESSVAEGGHATFVLDGQRVSGRALAGAEDDPERLVLELQRRILPEQAGTLTLAAPLVRFSAATRFRDDFLSGRVPVDPTERVVYGDPLELRVRALPVQGRPSGFSGAVGSFTASASVDVQAVAVGESFRLLLEVAGSGNLRLLDIGAFDALFRPLEAFHVFGRVELPPADPKDDRRTFVYDLAALDPGVAAVPALSLVYFDPAPPGTYHTAYTEVLPLSVEPAPADADAAALASIGARAPVPGVDDLFDIEPVGPPASRRSAPSDVTVLACLSAPWLLGAGILRWKRRAELRRRDPAGVRARAAAAHFRSAVQRESTDTAVGSAYSEYLAARLRIPTPAAISPDVGARLVAAGVSPDLAERAADTLDRLIAVRFGGMDAPNAAAAAREQVDALERTFRSREVAR